MDWELADRVSECLPGCRFTLQDMQAALRAGMADDPACEDLCSLLEAQEI